MSDVPYPEVASLPFTEFETHSYGPSGLQIAEYWTADPEQPLVFLIHGGCWLNAFDRRHIRPLASALAQHGVGVLSVEYRRVGDEGGGWPGSFDDVRQALDHATTLGHKNIILAGHSAGGHLALWLGATRTEHSPVSGVIGLAAISNLHAYARGTSGCEKATVQLMGGTPEAVKSRYDSASPHVLPVSTPALLLHGDADQIVTIEQSKAFAKKTNASLSPLPGKGHFDLIDPRGDVVELILDQIHKWQP